MNSENLTNISPVDGRYAKKVECLKVLCSEFALIKRRLQVEIEWLKVLAAEPTFKDLPAMSANAQEFLQNLITNFDLAAAQRIKDIEAKTNHDVKSVEYFLREKLQENSELRPYVRFIHFACTSSDINNLAYALMLKQVRSKYLIPLMNEIIENLLKLAKQYAKVPMLSRTHGQPATPTTVGKEFANFVLRLKRQYQQFSKTQILGKFNGTVGNFSAHVAAYPEVDWLALCQKFVEGFGLTWNLYTTQIEPHDYIAEFCSCLTRFNNILIMLARDMWGYIAFAYFKQKIVQHEIGSSVMPHKVNPIDFENAEGNLGIANSLLNYFINKLPISRFQRDLSDSTVLRNLGVAFAHTLIAYKSIIAGLDKIEVNQEKLSSDLNSHWEILAEAIQTIMRRYGIENAYEQLKELCRGKIVDREKLQQFILNLDLPREVKEKLLILVPENYLGKAVELSLDVDEYLR